MRLKSSHNTSREGGEMTLAEYLASVKKRLEAAESNGGAGQNIIRGITDEAIELMQAAPTDLARLIQIVEIQREALEIFKGIGDMGYEDTVMTFVEDPSVIDYAKKAIAKADAIAGEE